MNLYEKIFEWDSQYRQDVKPAIEDGNYSLAWGEMNEIYVGIQARRKELCSTDNIPILGGGERLRGWIRFVELHGSNPNLERTMKSFESALETSLERIRKQQDVLAA